MAPKPKVKRAKVWQVRIRRILRFLRILHDAMASLASHSASEENLDVELRRMESAEGAEEGEDKEEG